MQDRKYLTESMVVAAAAEVAKAPKLTAEQLTRWASIINTRPLEYSQVTDTKAVA